MLEHFRLLVDGGDAVKGAVITPSQFHRSTRSYEGAVYGRDGRLVEASRRQNDNDWKRADPASAAPVSNPLDIRRGVYLGHFFCHFGHFLIETLPQLYWATRYTGRPYIFHAWRDFEDHPDRLDLPYVRYCLEVLELPADTFMIVTDEALSVDRLCVLPRGNPVEAKPNLKTLGIYRTIAERTKHRLPDTGIRKAYLSRRGFKSDRGNNEDEVEAEFAARGFSVVRPETLPFADQVNLVSRCDVIAGLNGSAMHLGVFLKPGARQINLGPRGWKIQKPILDALGVMGDMLPDVAPGKAESRPLDVAGIGSWLDGQGFNAVRHAA